MGFDREPEIAVENSQEFEFFTEVFTVMTETP